MNDDLYDVLKRLWDNRKSQTWVFYNPKYKTRYHKRPKMMRSICKRAFAPELKTIKEFEGPVFNFHSLLHFMASYLADKEKVSLKTISKTLRHKNLKTTEIYLRSIDGQQKEALTKIEGKFVADRVAVPDENRNKKHNKNDKVALK